MPWLDLALAGLVVAAAVVAGAHLRHRTDPQLDRLEDAINDALRKRENGEDVCLPPRP